MRWEREGCCLIQQWKDNKPVTVLTTIHSANEFGMVERKVKLNDRWDKVEVRRPKAIDTYNQYMNGVDRSDQILAKNNTLRKCMRWWKTLFFHLIDIAVVNSFILFQLYRSQNKDVEELQRPKRYSVLEFREELARQFARLEEYGVPPLYCPPKKQPGEYETPHLPKISDRKRNCTVCYKQLKKQYKVNLYCSAPQCQVFLHCTKDKDCFGV